AATFGSGPLKLSGLENSGPCRLIWSCIDVQASVAARAHALGPRAGYGRLGERSAVPLRSRTPQSTTAKTSGRSASGFRTRVRSAWADRRSTLEMQKGRHYRPF